MVLPFAEFISGGPDHIGPVHTLGVGARSLLIAAPVFGTTLRSCWSTVGTQMIYVITHYLLLNCADNAFSVDALFREQRG
jgi:hypothetical protein